MNDIIIKQERIQTLLRGFLTLGDLTNIQTSPRSASLSFGKQEVHAQQKDSRTLHIDEIWTVNVSVTQAQQDIFQGVQFQS